MSWDYFMEHYNSTCHPDVVTGKYDGNTVLSHLSQYADFVNRDYILTYVAFVDMFTDISVLIKDDLVFETMVQDSFLLDKNGYEPAAPDYVITNTGMYYIIYYIYIYIVYIYIYCIYYSHTK